ncbi:phosphonoacetaldehyde reductase [Aerococcaceae bacterium 50-4]
MLFYNPVKIHSGENISHEIGSALVSLKTRKVDTILIIAYHSSVLELPQIKQLQEDFSTEIIIASKSNPTVNDIVVYLKQARRFSISAVIGIGGGTVLDIAKTVAYLYSSQIQSIEDLRTYLADISSDHPKLPWIGVPTTAGTGSEVTCWATIWDPGEMKKYSLDTQDNYAYAAFIDPKLQITAPMEVAVYSALDALTHAMEAYWAKQTNMISKAYALIAMQKIRSSLAVFVKDQTDHTAFNELSDGALFAGLAFSNTHTAGVHAISYPLTMAFGLPHGLAVSILLPKVWALNSGHFADETAMLDALNVDNPAALDQWIADMLDQLEISNKLQDYGVTNEDFQLIKANANTKGRADNNPAALSEVAVQTILENIY